MKNNLNSFSNYQDLSRAVAKKVLASIKESESIHLGLASGNSPLLSYQYLARLLDSQPHLTSKIRFFQLDEWLGLSESNPASCQYYLYNHVIRPWKLDPAQYFLLNGQHPDMAQQLKEMRCYLDKNPIDLCVLGIGKNGHLAFNEPGSSLKDECRIVSLANSSKKHEMLGGLKTKLEKGITIGLKEIMAAKELLLIVSGDGKQEARRNLIKKAPIASFPASAVYEHTNCTIYLDQETPN